MDHLSRISTRPAPTGRGPLPLAPLGVAAVLLVLVGCSSSVPPRTESSPALAAWQEPPQELSDQQQRHLRIFGPILLNPSTDIDAETRRAAATELIRIEAPEAVAVLAEGLRSGHAAVLSAVLDAMADESRLDPLLLEAAVAALEAADPAVLDQLSVVLSRYGDEGLARVAAVAADPDQSRSARLGAIRALGSFRSREGAEHLMVFLDDDRQENPEIVEAVCGSLQRLSGFPYGNDPEAWRGWWRDAQVLPPDEWFRFMIRTLTARNSALDQEVDQARRANQEMSQKLFDVYNELYPALDIDDQLQRLPDLLDHELAPIRRFAVGRVARLLRDSVRIPTEVQARLAARLQDDRPGVRREVAQLLDELDYPEVAAMIAEALRDEGDADVAVTYLGILERRPTPTALDVIARRLPDERAGDRAADALWALLRTDGMGESQRAQAASAVTAAIDARPSAALARLLAFVDDGAAATRLEAMLDDGDDPATRAAVAEGYAARGHARPLVDRAADGTIYPFAVAALARIGGPASMQQLIRLTPPSRLRDAWSAGVVEIAAGLTPAELLETDSQLNGLATPMPALRRDVLMLAAELPPEALPPAPRAEVLRRLTPLLLELGEASRAHDLLGALNGDAAGAELTNLRFKTAVLVRAYDDAAAVSSDAAIWVHLLVELVTEQPRPATALRDEILRRFGADLDGDLKSAFDAASQRLTDARSRGAAAGAAPNP